MKPFEPAYLNLLRSGALAARVREANARLEACDLCGWKCGKNRRAGKRGACRTGELAQVSSYGPHPGEEACLSGWAGSGTVFFSQCNLFCQFCQNADISQAGSGKEVTPEQLATFFLELQALGCHNINLVSPTHVVPQILAAVLIAAQAGLRLPLVYNTGGYDSLAALGLLDGVIDIYLPDMKYASPQAGLHYSRVRNYPQVNQAAVREMYRQTGELQLDPHGLAQRGLLVRHLVLPFDLAGTAQIARFLADEVSPETTLNVMDQYHPAYHAAQHPKLKRRTTPKEIEAAREQARAAGLRRLL